MRRRSFFKLGLLGACTVAAGGAVYRLARGPAPLRRFELDGEARAALAAIVPAMLGSALPPGAPADIRRRRPPRYKRPAGPA